MRKLLIPLFLTIYLLSACKKSDSVLTIRLYDKPLNIIKDNTQGKWKLIYKQGGICGSCVYKPPNNFFWEFNSNNRIRQFSNDSVVTDTSITWIRDKDIISDSTFIMNFLERGQSQRNYIVDGIYKDTLVLFDNAYDPISYHLTKSY